MSAGLPAEGSTVGGYRIESLVAEGGMGRVYRAIGPEGEQVALKLVKPDLAGDQVFRRRFHREASVAQRVTHPRVVSVLAAGEQDGIPYLAQTFINGGSLADKIEKEGTLELATMVKLCLRVAGGLDALHASGIVHRDVKPGNILLDEEGVAYITDFGLVKEHDASLLTKPGQALGSIDYMAPEQIRAEAVSAASDVYALGCVMCECLSGKPPFADRQGMKVLWAHLQDEPPDPCANRPDVPADVGAAVLRALEKDAARRPPSATAYARVLQAAAGLLLPPT
jgi:serine/threonine-protein kinase